MRHLTVFEMAIALVDTGIPVPPYPRPLYEHPSDLTPEVRRIIDGAFVHLCDAREFQVESLYEKHLAAGT